MKFRCAIRPDRQRGFSLVMAVFILVIMSMLGVSMLRISQTEAQASTHEILAVRAFYAAESGAQWGMNKLFLNLTQPLDAGCQQVEVNGGPNGAGGQWQDTHMQQCRLVELVVCRSRTINTVPPLASYHIESTSECGDDIYTARRTVEMEATRLIATP